MFGIFLFFCQLLRFLGKITWILSFSGKNDTESSRNFIKIPLLCEIGLNCLTESWRKVDAFSKTCPGRPIRALMGPVETPWGPRLSGLNTWNGRILRHLARGNCKVLYVWKWHVVPALPPTYGVWHLSLAVCCRVWHAKAKQIVLLLFGDADEIT